MIPFFIEGLIRVPVPGPHNGARRCLSGLYVRAAYLEMRQFLPARTCIFHQVEGLYIDKNVSFVDLKQAILLFCA